VRSLLPCAVVCQPSLKKACVALRLRAQDTRTREEELRGRVQVLEGTQGLLLQGLQGKVESLRKGIKDLKEKEEAKAREAELQAHSAQLESTEDAMLQTLANGMEFASVQVKELRKWAEHLE
jgi:hypothetical protein